ncbi:unnamed protein product [Sphagnum balticum]
MRPTGRAAFPFSGGGRRLALLLLLLRKKQEIDRSSVGIWRCQPHPQERSFTIEDATDRRDAGDSTGGIGLWAAAV